MGKAKHRKQLFSVILAASMVAGSLTGITLGEAVVVKAETGNTAPGKPTDLKTELMSEAYGINTKNPAFSWVVNDVDKDEIQTAYRLVVSKTKEITDSSKVHDTGWVESEENSYVHVSALKNILEDNQLYYWHVQTKDKEGAESPFSETAVFMTDIASEWESTDGIWAVPETGGSSWTDYTVEAKISVLSGDGFGILMRMDGNQNGYMFQFRSKDNTVACHWAEKGSITGDTLFQTLNLTNSGITIPSGSEFNIKLAMAGTEIRVSIDTGSGYKDAGTVDLSKVTKINVSAGSMGFRTGRSESGTVDDLKITDSSGNILYESDFAEANGFFPGCSVSNGKLSVGNSAFSVWNDPNKLTELGNISFIRSPKITIENKENIEKVIVSAASRGTAQDRGTIFDIFFNGTCIGAGSARELGNVGNFSGTSNYTQVYYNSYDVTDAVVQGDANVISAVANSRDTNHGILVQMTAFYKDGTKRVLTNSGKADSGWKTLDGTSAFGDTGNYITTGYVSIFHDNINMNAYPTGWNEASFDDSDWQAAKLSAKVAENKTGTSGRVLYPSQSENALRMETNEPAKHLYKNAAGNIVIDLGKEIIGGLKVNITSSEAQSITVYMGEEMDGDSVKHKLTAVPDYVDTWTLKEGTNAFETITFRTFRYVELIGLDETTKTNILADTNSVKGWAIQQEFDNEDSSFVAAGEGAESVLLNRLYELSKYTIQATNQDVFVDSQARERAPYEGDLLVNSNTSYAVSSNYSLARHSNEWLIDNPTWPNDYSLFSVEMSYWDYIYTGNTDSIRENYAALKKKLTTKVASEDAATGLIRVNGSQAGETALIDWPTSERDGYQGSHYDVVINAEYVGIYRYMAIISEALGQSVDAASYKAKADKLQSSLITYAYDNTNGCFYDSLDQSYNATRHSSTHATAYALTYGVFDSQDMADDMCTFVYNNCKDAFKGSVYVTYFILKGLYTGNHGEMAQKLMTNPKVGTDVKTFASLLDNLNCTITPEAWGHAHKGNMTLSHPWGASPGCSIVQGLFGILPTKAGFEEFSVKLQPGGIASASVKAPTVKGAVLVSYENGSEEDLAANRLTASVTVPTNTRAVVSLPVTGTEYAYLMVDGVKSEADYDGTYLTVTVGSGTHTFAISEDTIDKATYFEMKAGAGASTLQIGDETQITTTLTDRANQNITDAEISYESKNPEVITVDENGVVSAVGSGRAVVAVTAVYSGVTKTKNISFKVNAELTGMSLSLSGGNTIAKDDSDTAVLYKVYNDGKKEAVTSGVAYSGEGDALEVDSAGVVTAKKEGKATIIACPSVLDKESLALPVEITSNEVWKFDGTTNPFSSSVTLSDSRLSVPVSASVNNTQYQGNIVSGKFEIGDVAATVAFNVKDDQNRYFWQFSKTEGLKRHTQINNEIAQYGGSVPITLKDGENTFVIATKEKKIYTWLNGECVDIYDAHDSLPGSGGFGVRTGRTESFSLSEISVENDWKAVWAKAEITVTKAVPYIVSAAELSDVEVGKGTTFEQLKQKLPVAVKVTLNDNTTKEAEVEWSSDDYRAEMAGTYTLTGTLAAGEDYRNSGNVQVSIHVVVKETSAFDGNQGGTGGNGSGGNQEGTGGNGSGGNQDITKATVKLNATSLPLQKKKSTKVLKASGMIAGDKVAKWESSKPSVASVDAKSGKITAKQIGTTKITVTTEKGATASCTIKVQKAKVTTKKLNVTNVKGSKLTLKKKKSYKLAVEHQPLTATDKITYKSSKPSVAKVSKSGKITAKKKGKTVITIKSANGKRKKINVTVK